MNKLYVLTKVLLKNSWSTFSTGKNRTRKNIIYVALIALGVLPMVIGIGTSTASIYDLFVQIHQEGVLLTTGFTSITLLILVFGMFYVVNIFYFSRDIDKLLPLPIKPIQLISSKFCVALIYEYLTVSLFLLPLLIAYGIKSSGGFLYYFYSFLLLLAVPVVPLIISSVIIMITMRFSKITRRRDQFRIIAAIVGILLVLVINYFTTNYLNTADHPEKALSLLKGGSNTFIDIVAKIFPAAKMAASCLLNYSNYIGLLNVVLFYLFNSAFVIVFLILGQIFYLRGVVGGSEVFSEKKIISRDEINKFSVKSPRIKSYMMKEIKILFRTPAFFINCILSNILWPVILVAAFLGIDNQLDKIRLFIQSNSSENIVVVAALAISMFITASNGITASAISREGNNFYINKYLPVQYYKIIFAKLFAGVVISLSGCILVLFLALILFKFSLAVFILSVILSLPGILFASQIGLLMDVNYPKLTWDNEYKPVKQNMNILINLFVSSMLGGIAVFITIYLKFTLSEVMSRVGLILILFDLGLFRILINKGNKLIQIMDV